MEKLVTWTLMAVLFSVTFMAVSALFALPVMWLVNYTFSPVALTAMFGGPLDFWRALALLLACGLLVRGYGATASKSKS